MDWLIKQTIICPKTASAYSVATQIRTDRKLILYYHGNYFMWKGNVLTVGPCGLIVNGRPPELKILHTMPYSDYLWETLKQHIQCPGNNEPYLRKCEKRAECIFKECPYGLPSAS